MSKIDKLNITGIRSFNTQRGETIQFYTPLTLIVGTNGSGKTTIIESLKYVTTGELPPGAKKGGAFIHDPKLLGEREVMAQAKLQFKSVHGYRMVITRTLQVTITKNSRSQKALEGSLLMDKNGEKIVASNRVAELDSVVPQHLGVSSAVLDNVIFCHQEESLWPMSEPLSLKKKFDEIFEAQKYIKAIDNIKAIRKTHNEKLGQYKILEQHAKEDRDRADRARKKSEGLQKEIEEKRAKCLDLDKKIEHAQHAANNAWKESESYARILGALEGKRIEAKNRHNIISDIKIHLKEVTESDEWLEHTLEQFNVTMDRYEEERQTKREQWLEWKDEIKEMQDKLAQKFAERGKHEQDREEYERQLDRRKTKVKEAAARHQMRGYDDLGDENLVEEFLFKIRKIFKDHNSALERARGSAGAEQQEALSNVNRLTERKTALQDNKVTARNQIASNDREANEFQRKANQIQVDEGSAAVIESRIEDVNTALLNAREAAQHADWAANISKARQQLRVQEDQRAELNNELVQGTKRASEVAKLSHLKQELKERQRSLQTLLNTHSDRIKKLVGDAWSSSDLESCHRTALEEASRALSMAERERDVAAREIEQIQFKQKSCKTEISTKSKQIQTYTKSVEDTIGVEITEYDTVLKDAQEQLDNARDQTKGVGGLADFFNKVLDVADRTCSCRLCGRAFKSPRDENFLKFKTKIEDLIEKATNQAEEADLAAAEATHKQVQDLALSVSTWKRLTEEEVPTLKNELDKLSQQKEILLKKAEKHDKIVEQKQTARKELESVERTVASIARCDTEITSFSNQIEELSTKQSQHGSTRTLEDIQDDIKKATESVRNINKTITQLNADQDASTTELHRLEIQLGELRNELGTANSELQKKATLIARVEEFKVLNHKQRDAVDRADKAIEGIEPEILTAKAKYEDIAQRWTTQIADLTRDADELSDTVNNLNLLNTQVKSYIERDGPNQLLSVKREISNLEQEVEKANAAQVELTREINKVEEQLRDSTSTKRQYSDNLRFRQESRMLEQLQDEITELESRNAHVDRDRFEEESKRFTNQYHKYSAEREGCLGEMKSRDVQLAELIDDYKTDFQDAPKRYKEAHIRVETTKATIEDLARYAGALDKAIMKFHSLKMNQINDIIEDLWRNTYQGTDVDEIKIRSDPEQETKASTTAAARRQYNYRVTMVKQGVEMDMRGRCSAGQRVLACIIIRLALAEVFSANCGIIALDEPTTNLDRENIEALAKSLHQMIKTRRQQSNFQLIVITHDEEFLKHMDCSEFTDYYYRVSRDGSGDSVIERQDILAVDR